MTDEAVNPVVIDLGVGNIGSLVKSLTRIGFAPSVRREAGDAGPGGPVIIPGIGQFSYAIQRIDSLGWRTWLNDARIAGRPILGICLGAQLMCQGSEEGPGEGLGWLPLSVRRFPTITTQGHPLRVPHMGWQQFTPPATLLPFPVTDGRMYYAHSFFIEISASSQVTPYLSSYGGVRFASIVRAECAWGVQFHPERSCCCGSEFIRGWMAWATRQDLP